MRKSAIIILALLAGLVAVVTGCGGAVHYDSRLSVADSLMQSDPDSALVIVEGLPLSELTTAGDSAYHDLLLTQARYRCYVTATSDSAINRALGYYRAHSGEREKLTRALLYKGAVMEELGHTDSAMIYYKHAEATAAHDDYFVLGQINTRIADLYRFHYADKQKCYEKYKKALDYYIITEDKGLQMICISNMGMCSGIIGNGDSRQLLDTASVMALELNDSSAYYECQEMISRQLSMNDSTCNESKQIALHVLHVFSGTPLLTSDLFLDLANVYYRQGLADSAKYYACTVEAQLKPASDARIKIRTYDIMAKISEFEGNKSLSHHYLNQSRLLSDSISNNKQKYRIQSIENMENERVALNDQHQRNKRLWMAGIIATLLAATMLLFIVYQYRKILIVKTILKDAKNESLNKHEAFLEKLQAKESSVDTLVRNMVAFMQTAIDTAEHDPLSTIRKRINDTIRSIANEDFWTELREYLDKNYNNIITDIAKNEKILESDIRLIELELCGFSYIEIAITMDYSPKYVSNKRKKIEKKLGLKTSLHTFISDAMKD